MIRIYLLHLPSLAAAANLPLEATGGAKRRLERSGGELLLKYALADWKKRSRADVRPTLADFPRTARAASPVFHRLSLSPAALEALLRAPAPHTETAAHGKPYLTDDPTLFYSLSHSGDLAALALSDENVGLDLQRARPLRGMELADRFFTAEDSALLGQCEDEAARAALFFRMWTVKEAYIKYTGRGMAETLRSFDIDWQARAIVSRTGSAPAYFAEIPVAAVGSEVPARAATSEHSTPTQAEMPPEHSAPTQESHDDGAAARASDYYMTLAAYNAAPVPEVTFLAFA